MAKSGMCADSFFCELNDLELTKGYSVAEKVVRRFIYRRSFTQGIREVSP